MILLRILGGMICMIVGLVSLVLAGAYFISTDDPMVLFIVAWFLMLAFLCFMGVHRLWQYERM